MVTLRRLSGIPGKCLDRLVPHVCHVLLQLSLLLPYGGDKERQEFIPHFVSFFVSLDLERVSRKLAAAFVVFMVGTYFITYIDGFEIVFIKGLVLSIIVFPPIYFHYNDETKYRFEIVKGD
jgi:hypothetical protein